MLLRYILSSFLLSTALFSVEFEYKTGDKKETLGILQEVNSLLNNQSVKKRYYLKPGETSCKENYVLNGKYCEMREEMKYSVVGNVVMLDNADTVLSIDVTSNREVDGTLKDTPSSLPNFPKEVNLKDSKILTVDDIVAGGVVCQEDKRTFEVTSQPNSTDDVSNTVFSYYIVDIPADPVEADQMRDIVRNNYQCEFYGLPDSSTVKNRISTEVDVKRKENVLEEGDTVNTIGLSHIPTLVESIDEDGTLVKTSFKDSADNVIAKPSVIKFHPVKLTLSKTFHVPTGNLSVNKFSSNYVSGKTELTTYETEYTEFPDTKEAFYENAGKYVVYPTEIKCKNETQDKDVDLLIKKRNNKTNYSVIVNYGNILTEYNSDMELSLFNKEDLQRYVVGTYNLDSKVYEDFSDRIPYNIIVKRNANNASIPHGELKNKEAVMHKILPIIQNVDKDVSCNEFGENRVKERFSEAYLYLIDKDSKAIVKKKYVGLVDTAKASNFATSDAKEGTIVSTLRNHFETTVEVYTSAVNNFVSYDFERVPGIVKEIPLAPSATVNLYNYNDDIFKQFVSGSDQETLMYERKMILNPVDITMKYYKCNEK